ncbi:hypothetical protein LAZ67_16002568 [Cordylochernes scorpioides]|uniref:Uncharacterized protein n=1 Tax=Cordylochernes scorpioides TaxID=51811 RepID=A0ABY6LG96_9ARAC|nr:hypothetical protein LAZ67_16002568 [Cordylochernes scorpioides]
MGENGENNGTFCMRQFGVVQFGLSNKSHEVFHPSRLFIDQRRHDSRGFPTAESVRAPSSESVRNYKHDVSFRVCLMPLIDGQRFGRDNIAAGILPSTLPRIGRKKVSKIDTSSSHMNQEINQEGQLDQLIKNDFSLSGKRCRMERFTILRVILALMAIPAYGPEGLCQESLILNETNPGESLESQIGKQRLIYFEHIMRKDGL